MAKTLRGEVVVNLPRASNPSSLFELPTSLYELRRDKMARQ